MSYQKCLSSSDIAPSVISLMPLLWMVSNSLMVSDVYVHPCRT